MNEKDKIIPNSVLLLYQAIQNKLPPKYTDVKWGDLQEGKERCVGIYDEQAGNDEDTIDGENQYKRIKFNIRANAPKGITGYSETLDYLNEFIRNIENSPCDISGLSFIDVIHLGQGAHRDYRDKFGLIVCAADIEIKYVFE